MSQPETPITDPKFVETLIPQKAPFVMVDKIIFFSEHNITSGFKIPAENIFVKENRFQESGLIEHMAQSVALYTGYSFYLKGNPAPTGYIGSLNSIKIMELPETDEEIESSVQIVQEFGDVTLVSVSTKRNGKEIAFGQMKTVLAPI